MQNQTSPSPTSLPPAVAAVLSCNVADYGLWKAAFDRHAEVRRRAGIVASHINRDVANPNQLSIYLAGSDPDRLQAFLASAELMATMVDAGVKGPPHIALVTPVEDLTSKSQPLAGAIVRHEVRDFAIWKRAFDGHAQARARAGIVGHAINRAVQNPNLVIIYLQAQTEDQLRAFTASADLKQVMQTAGVVGAPELNFVTGGDWQIDPSATH